MVRRKGRGRKQTTSRKSRWAGRIRDEMEEELQCAHLLMLYFYVKQAHINVTQKQRLTHPVLLSRCTPGWEVHCWRATGGPPEITEGFITVVRMRPSEWDKIYIKHEGCWGMQNKMEEEDYSRWQTGCFPAWWCLRPGRPSISRSAVWEQETGWWWMFGQCVCVCVCVCVCGDWFECDVPGKGILVPFRRGLSGNKLPEGPKISVGHQGHPNFSHFPSLHVPASFLYYLSANVKVF